MVMDKILEFIELQDTISYNQSFDLALKCSRLIASGTEEELVMARKIIIRVLDELKKIPKETYDIWSDLVEAVGFYPYLEKNKKILEQNSLADEIRIQSYKSDYLDNKYMHIKQKELSDLLKSEVNVVASAPTSFGKSLLIEEIVASGIYNNIIIIQPTLALLDETRIKLRKYKDRYKTIVRTSQAYSVDKGNLFLLTAERVMEYEEFPHIDLLIIDEFYKLSLRRKDERANILNNAFLRIVNKYNSKFYLLGPNIDGITEGFADKYNAVFFKSSYSLVDCDVIDKSKQLGCELSKAKYENRKIELLCELLYELKNEQTIIYFSSPARARKYAKIYCNYLAERESEKKEELPLVAWIEENVSKRWGLVNELKNEIAIHDGSLQKHIGAAIIDYFNDGKLKYIFCTSTIIEGVNTSAKNVVIFDGTILDNINYANNDVSREEIINICKKLKIHDKIINLENGYDTFITSDTDLLSTGEKQLLNFARVMVEDPEIIILDEATASLSYKSEMLIRNAIDEITKNKISFIIAHRLSTIKECSQILYLDKGKIIEQGTHKELINKKGSYFKLLTEDSKVK